MKLAIYISHYETLGHITRIASILGNLGSLSNNIKILLIISGKKQKAINLEKYGEVLHLPYSIGRRGLVLEENKQIYNKIINSEGINIFLKKRLKVLRGILKKFDPDLFITEYYPFGSEFWSFELPIVLKYIKENFRTKIFSSIGYPSWMMDTNKILEEFYNGIFIHCPPDYYHNYVKYMATRNPGKKVLSQTIKMFSKRIYFTGYVLDKKRLISKDVLKKRICPKKNQKFVVVSRGGGIVNSKIIFYSIRLAKYLKNVFFLVSTGPATKEREFKEYSRVSKRIKNVKIVRYLPNFEDYLYASDLSINMAGYNTIVRLLWLKKQSIIVPFNTDEQRFRAHYLEKFEIFKILSYESLCYKNLKKSVLDMLRSPLKPSRFIEDVDFNGIENMVKLINNA